MTDIRLAEEINFLPSLFPEKWATEWGEDAIGLWMAFIFKNVRQTFRWIPPGTFQMGSAKSEKQRNDNEPQHQVTLTQGYWLADTACTQALWQAVMGNNPARFKEDEQQPVEQISWEDVQEFLQQLNTLIPGLAAQLPTEAQWEYACRAGTRTPFSFGDNITPEQVNYDGEYPYAEGKQGLDREKTVPVKSLPANPWGLYEMHGNVWEWCQDWFADYPQVVVADPEGAETGTDRVLRGGSWFFSGGGGARSALRDAGAPDSRGLIIGFRFAPGQARNRAAEPQVAASERGKAGG